MKITKSRLRSIILEEKAKIVNEMRGRLQPALAKSAAMGQFHTDLDQLIDSQGNETTKLLLDKAVAKVENMSDNELAALRMVLGDSGAGAALRMVLKVTEAFSNTAAGLEELKGVSDDWDHEYDHHQQRYQEPVTNKSETDAEWLASREADTYSHRMVPDYKNRSY